MSDLDKIMKKLKKTNDDEKVTVETIETESKEDESDDEIVKDQDTELSDDEIVKDQDTELSDDDKKKNPSNVDDELLILQNNGVYRRELLLVEKDKSISLRIIAQTLMTIRDLLEGNDGDKKK